jgi:hypothetical protein
MTYFSTIVGSIGLDQEVQHILRCFMSRIEMCIDARRVSSVLCILTAKET